MTEKYLYNMFIVFVVAIVFFASLQTYLTQNRISHCTQVPSSPVLDSSHVKEVMRNLCGFESSFIPEFCADKLGRRTNSIPALLMKR